MKRKIYIPIWFILIIAVPTIFIVWYVLSCGSDALSSGYHRLRGAYVGALMTAIPLSIATIYTLNSCIVIYDQCFKIKCPGTYMKVFPKMIKYDEIKKIEIEKTKAFGKIGCVYKLYMKEGKGGDEQDFFFSSHLFLRKKQFEKDMATLAEMINSKNALENKEDQVRPSSETINN